MESLQVHNVSYQSNDLANNYCRKKMSNHCIFNNKKLNSLNFSAKHEKKLRVKLTSNHLFQLTKNNALNKVFNNVTRQSPTSPYMTQNHTFSNSISRFSISGAADGMSLASWQYSTIIFSSISTVLKQHNNLLHSNDKDMCKQPVMGTSKTLDTLAIPTSRLSTVGDRAFPVTAARVWNALPADVISSTTLPAFKQLLKTELFSRSFPDVWCSSSCTCLLKLIAWL